MRLNKLIPSVVVVLTSYFSHDIEATQVINTIPLGHASRNHELLERLRQEMSFDVVLQDIGNYNSAAMKESSGTQAEKLRRELETQVLQMTDASGQEFECKIAADAAGGVASSNRAPRAPPPEEVNVESVHEVLKELEGVCSTIRKGYWSYEWCHNAMVRQFHVENGATTADWSLGSFAPDRNSLGSHRAQPPKAQEVLEPEAASPAEGGKEKAKISRPTYFSQVFENGQHCDETGAPRQSEVRLYCCPHLAESVLPQPGTKHPVRLQQIEEISICSYTVSVCSPLVCQAGVVAPDEVEAWRVLRSLVGQCFTRHIEWWSYEFCFEQHIRQFHVASGKDGKGGKKKQTVTDDFLLGKFDPSVDVKELEMVKALALDDEAQTQLFLDEGPEPAIVQVYPGGSPCEMTGKQRQTFVRYVCKSRERSSMILSIEEVATCQYNVVVHTPLVCKHRLFQQEKQVTDKLSCKKKSDGSLGTQQKEPNDVESNP